MNIKSINPELAAMLTDPYYKEYPHLLALNFNIAANVLAASGQHEKAQVLRNAIQKS